LEILETFSMGWPQTVIALNLNLPSSYV
jgi:hypothetical protein